MSIIDDINNLDPSNPGVWPVGFKIAVFVIVFVALVYAGWHFDITKLREELAGLKQKEIEQIQVLEIRQKKVANLDALKDQMKEMEQSFDDMLRQLPNKTEVADLLIDISQTGLAAGLEFNLFQPKGETPREFYAELPINISIVGDYHQFGEFVSGIAALPRIVTTHDIQIQPIGAEAPAERPLSMTAVAKTYRALEEEN